MCDPISVIAGISAGTSLYGSIKSGKAAKRQGAAQQASYEYAAKSRLQKVSYDIETAERSFVRSRGTAQASIGASGISQTSFYDVLADSAVEFALEKKAIEYTGKQEADQLRQQGQIAYQSGKDQASASYIRGVSSALGSLGGIKLGSLFDTGSGWQTTTYNASGQII